LAIIIIPRIPVCIVRMSVVNPGTIPAIMPAMAPDIVVVMVPHIMPVVMPVVVGLRDLSWRG
jgi:hypothetical protein